MVAGEHQGQAFARVRLTAKSDEVARQMLSVVKGFVANARLQCGDDEEAKNLLQALVIASDGKAVTIEWKGSVDGVLKFVGKRMAKHRNSKQRDSKHRDGKHLDGKRKPK